VAVIEIAPVGSMILEVGGELDRKIGGVCLLRSLFQFPITTLIGNAAGAGCLLARVALRPWGAKPAHL
jgi:hypothetical protein